MSQAIMAPVGAIAEPGLPARIQARLRRQTARWRTPGWDSMARAAKRRAGSLQAALAGWVPIGQEKASLAARSLSHAIAATRHTDWARRFGHLRRRPIGWAWRPASANRLLHRCKKILAIAAETGWKRYAVLALLSGAVMIETFFFAGANTLLRPDKPTPGHSYNADVDQLFARIDNAPTADKTQNLTVGKAPKVEKAREARPKLADSTSRAERAKAQSKPGERAAIDKPRRSSFARAGPEKPSQQPAVQEPRPRAPNVSPGGAEKSNAAKIQLNVQWED